MALAPLLEHHRGRATALRARPRRGRGVLLRVAAAVSDRRAAIARPTPGARGARRWSWSATTAPRASWRRDLRAGWRRGAVRFYPSRGVTYESHLAPPPHLVGLRIAALDALLDRARRATSGRRWWSSAPRAVGEGARPGAAPALVHAAVGELLDLDECAPSWSRWATSASRRSRSAASSRCAAGCSTCSPRPRSAPCASSCSTSRSSRCARSRRSPSARSATLEQVEIAPAAELALEHRELAEIAASDGRAERPDIAELLPLERFGALLDLVGDDAELLVAAEEEIGPTLRDHWADVCAAFHDADAHHLYVAPSEIEAALARARADLAALDRRRPAARVPRAGRRHRRALARRGRGRARALPALRLPHRRHVGAPRRRRARRAQPRAADSDLARGRRRAAPGARASLRFAQATLREGFVAPRLRLAVIPDHRLFRRRRAGARRGRGRPGAGGAARCARSPTCAPATSSSTRTTASRASPASRRAPSPASRATTCYLEYQGDDRVFVPHRAAREDLALRRRRRRAPAALEARRHALGRR